MCRAVFEMSPYYVFGRLGAEAFQPLARCLLSQGRKEQHQLMAMIRYRLLREFAFRFKVTKIRVEEPGIRRDTRF